MITAVLLSIVGTIGFTVEDSVESIPTPNVPNSVFLLMTPYHQTLWHYLYRPMQSFTWDRSDVFLVVGDSEKKNSVMD